MTVVVITAESSVLQPAVRQLHDAGHTAIQYGSVIKALDNIIEIQPDALIISAQEYSRHWKIIAQYTSGIVSQQEAPLIIVTDCGLFSSDEIKKAEALHVYRASDTENILEYISKSDKKRLNYMVFSHPDTNTFIFGTVKKVSAAEYAFTGYCRDHFVLQPNQKIYASIMWNDFTVSAQCIVSCCTGENSFRFNICQP